MDESAAAFLIVAMAVLIGLCVSMTTGYIMAPVLVETTDGSTIIRIKKGWSAKKGAQGGYYQLTPVGSGKANELNNKNN